ncbi:hypothetical protein [Moorena producens]|uniref:hypothetical protein n=1 Tax=Moorena producens TaxID=1155739 RepID=UPI003C71E63E
MDNSASPANNFQQSGSPENSPLLSRLQRRQEKSGGVINTRQLHRHYQSTQATTGRLTQRLTLPEQINSRYGASGLQPKLNMERFSRPRVESADVSNTYLEPTNVAPSNVALSGRGEGVQRSIATRTNSRQFPSNLGHQGRSQPPSPSVPSTSPKVPIISQIKSSTVPRSRGCFQSFPQDYDPPQPPARKGEPYSKSPERGIARSGDNGGSPSLKTRPSAQPPTSLPRQVKVNRQATLSALQDKFTPPESVQSQVVPPKTEGDSHSPSPVIPASVVQTKLVVAKATQPLATGKTSSAPDLVWRSQEEEESDSSFLQTKLSDSNLNQDISLVQTKPVLVKPSQPSLTTTTTPTKTTNLTKDTAINNSAQDLVWRSQEEEESDNSLVQTKLSDSNQNQDISLLQTKSVVLKPSQALPTTTITPTKTTNLTKDTAINNSAPDLVWRSQEKEESDSSLLQTKLSDSNPNQDISLVQTKSVVVKPSQPSLTTTTSPSKTTNLTKDTAINNSAPDLVWRSQEEEESDSSLLQTKLSDSKPNQDISLVQTKSVTITPTKTTNLTKDTAINNSADNLVWRSQEEEESDSSLVQTKLSNSKPNQDISLVQTKSVVLKPSQPLPTTTITPTKTTNLTKDTAINNSAPDLVWCSQEEEESDSSLVQTKLSNSKPNQDISLVQTKSVVIKPSQPSPTTTTSPTTKINLDTDTGKTSSTPDLVWRKTDNDSVAKVSKLQQLSASHHNQSTALPLATQPVRSDGVIARQPNLTGANSIPMTAPVTSNTATSNLPTTPADGVDIDIEAIAEHVSRILTRQLTMEQERRGIEKWH